MTKNSISPEEIVRLFNEGYHFRKKSIKGTLYISARKGKQEKGLGKFNQNLWDMIERVKSQNATQPKTSPVVETDQPSKQNNSSLNSPRFHEVTLHGGRYEKAVFSDNELENALFNIKYERAKIKMKDCQHSVDRFCQYWYFDENSKIISEIFERFRVSEYKVEKLKYLSEYDVFVRNLLRVSELLCFDCDKYFQRPNIK